MQWLRTRPSPGELDGPDHEGEANEAKNDAAGNGGEGIPVDTPTTPAVNMTAGEVNAIAPGLWREGAIGRQPPYPTSQAASASTTPRVYRALPPRASPSTPAAVLVTTATVSPPSSATFDFTALPLSTPGSLARSKLLQSGLTAVKGRVERESAARREATVA